jgi:hypothetical protein
MGAHAVNTTALVSGRFLNRHTLPIRCAIPAGMLRGIGRAIGRHPTIPPNHANQRFPASRLLGHGP